MGNVVRKVRVSVGEPGREWIPDEGEPSRHHGYAPVTVQIGERSHRVGVAVGIPEWQRGMGAVPVSAWWTDASDWDGLSVAERDAVLSAIIEAAPRLWRTLQDRRSAEVSS